jgi:hypothetical protein
MNPISRIKVLAILSCSILFVTSMFVEVGTADETASQRSAANSAVIAASQLSGLPLPSTLPTAKYEELLFNFVNQRRYVELGWTVDKSIRDTGPWLNGKYYGTHPAVRIFYSPEILQWLVANRVDEIPDGAMIIKEQYAPPAARHEGKDEDQLWEGLTSWTIMVKDAVGSHDGWFWSNPAKGQKPVDSFAYPFEEPISGFGLYCVRCHASAQSPARGLPGRTNEYTFASLRNIKGFPGSPLAFRVDDTWRPDHERNRPVIAEDLRNESKLAEVAAKTPSAHPRCTDVDQPERCITRINEQFLKTFPSISKQTPIDILRIPPVTHDTVPRSSPTKSPTQGFVTSNQCMSCHAGITEPYGPTMFLPTGSSAEYGEPGIHVSPYGEWRWSPMGLAGRDPIFFAQVESELEIIKQELKPDEADLVSKNLVHTCLGCHGVMGRRQFDIDHGGKDHFSMATIYNESNHPQAKDAQEYHYGALARDGISCAVCHRIQPRPQPEGDQRPYLQHFLATSITGNFFTGKADELYGPFKDQEIAPYAMEHAIGFKPKHSEFIKSSQMCGTCHTVNLPSIDHPYLPGEATDELIEAEPNPLFKKFHHHVEQATYLEWLNSEYENEFQVNNPKAKSCQDCHMAKGIHDEGSGINLTQIQTRIAAIQDESYPEAENIAAPADLTVRYRKQGYSRHNFKGLNVFLLEMFRQFDDLLGVRKVDYMTGSSQDIDHAIRDFVQQAKHQTAELKLSTRWLENGKLEAEVLVQNLAGHRFPSGVGFRRAFLEVSVFDESKPEGKPIWSSGSTNEVGQIVDGTGKPLATEFFDRKSTTGGQQYQPHHEIITASNQVQVYETLLCNAKHQLTTSFVHGCEILKDNRLLPRGWQADGRNPALTGAFLKATHPDPITQTDPQYQDGSGSDKTLYHIAISDKLDRSKLRVSATLYYQAIPPYFLKSLFDTAPNGPATKRLHYLCSNLVLDGTVIENWKLKIVSASDSPISPNESR